MQLKDLKSNWFIPINNSQTKGNLGSIENFIALAKTSNFSKKPIVFLHLNVEDDANIFSELLNYNLNFKSLSLFDFGQIATLDPILLDNVFNLIQLYNGHIVIFDANPHPSLSIKDKGICHISPRIDLKIENYTKEYCKLTSSSLIGYQTYLSNPDVYTTIDTELVRLGQLRSNIESTEPIIRRADALLFNAASIKHSDCPLTSFPNPSGLFLEEACRIARYAGLNEKLNLIHLYGYTPLKETSTLNTITSHALAQLVWYFLNGVDSRINDYPNSTSNLKEFIISIKDHDISLSFWKSTLSGRWWIQVPNKNENPLFPCSYDDYLAATEGLLSSTVLKALEIS